MVELKPNDYERVRPLLGPTLSHHLFCMGVVMGKYPGKVMVDDPDRPRSALIVKDSWCYLAGDPENESFNQQVATALANRQIMGEKSFAMMFSLSSAGWVPFVNRIFADRASIPTARHLYVADSEHFTDRPLTNDAFSLRFIDDALPSMVDGDLPEDVRKILQLRSEAAEPDQAAFGFAALNERQCAAWAMVDCIVEPRGDIGLVTDSPFRRRGLAAATSAATIAYGLEHGLEEIHWDVAAHNVGSIRTAEKLGLHKVQTYDQHVLIFDKRIHLINLAWNHINANRFDSSLAVSRQLRALDGKDSYAYFLLGASWAGLMAMENGLQALKTAAELGWDDLAEVDNCPPLKNLVGVDGWGEIVERFRANQAKGN
ncbi:MAG: GNAT family N-acetyltransferase [Ardenticatenaceae bacterium]|nr:GNAT family N-acetyltransferase [Ardenticatenaceae bacterium]